MTPVTVTILYHCTIRSVCIFLLSATWSAIIWHGIFTRSTSFIFLYRQHYLRGEGLVPSHAWDETEYTAHSIVPTPQVQCLVHFCMPFWVSFWLCLSTFYVFLNHIFRLDDEDLTFVELPKAGHLLKTVITETGNFTVGPLDYCGVARIEKAQGGGAEMWVSFLCFFYNLRLMFTLSVFVCEEDPRLNSFYVAKRATRRAIKGLNKLGQRRISLQHSTRSNKKIKISLRSVRVSVDPPTTSSSEDKPPPAKRRKTADGCISMGASTSPRKMRSCLSRGSW